MGANRDTAVWGPGDSSLRDRPCFPGSLLTWGLDL